jgi:hypothetical protein
MPNYRATVTFNSWLLRSRAFAAKDDEAARTMQSELDEWASEIMRAAANHPGGDMPILPDAVVTVDRLDAHGVMEDEIYFFRHSQSHPFGPDLLAFAAKIARLTLFAESDYVTGRPEGTDPEAVQTDLDWLTAQDETLESLIREARALTATGNQHQAPQTDGTASASAKPQTGWGNKHPLIDEGHDGNDKQIADLKDLVHALTSSLEAAATALEGWMEIADKGDERQSDCDALTNAQNLIAMVRAGDTPGPPPSG